MSSSSPLRLEVLSDDGALERIVPAWETLLSGCVDAQIASTPLWLTTWWKIFSRLGGRELRLALFWRGDVLVGFAPLLLRLRWSKIGLPFRRLELLGTGEPEEHEIATDYGAVLALPGHEAEVARALAVALLEERLGPWDELGLTAIDASAPMTEKLSHDLTRLGLPVERQERVGSPYIPLPASFEAYLAALSSSSRYFVKRSQRDFEAWSKGVYEIRRATTVADLAEGQAILMSSHAERWSKDGQHGVFASPHFHAFHQAIMEALLARGALDLRWLVVDGRPIAAIYNYLYRGRVHFYQSGRVVDLPKEARAGIVLQLAAIRDAIAAGHREYDFLAGDSRYKLQLCLAVRPLTNLTVARPGLRRALNDAARAWKARRSPAVTEGTPAASASAD